MNFKAADTQLLLGSGAGETRLEHMDMLLLIQPGKADLRECHASLQGLRIEAKCAFVAAAHAGNAEAVAASRQAAQQRGLVPRCESRLAEVGKGVAEVSPGEG